MLAGARADDRVLALGPLGVGTKRATEAMTTSTGISGSAASSSPFPTYEPRYVPFYSRASVLWMGSTLHTHHIVSPNTASSPTSGGCSARPTRSSKHHTDATTMRRTTTSTITSPRPT